MKYTLLFFLGIATISGAYASDLETIFGRTLIVTDNIEVSKRFYTYGLGWKVLRDAPIADKITYRHLGIPDTHTARIVVLQPAKSLHGKVREGAVLALLQIDNPKLPRINPPQLAVGTHLLAVRTNDIKTVIARLKELGTTFAVEPVVTPDGLTEMAVIDPNGVRLQINEWVR